jgi:hypothetical protein
MFQKTRAKLYGNRKEIMKNIAKSLCAIIIFVSIPISNAFADGTTGDIYAQKLTENINIEGVQYQYKYYYDNSGEKCISVTNKSTSETNIIRYDEKASSIYLDSKKIATIKSKENPNELIKKDIPKFNLETLTKSSSDGWKLQGTKHKYITWAEGVAAGIIAGAIAAVLGNISAGTIVAVIGFGALSVLGASCAGGTVHWTTYYQTSLLAWHYKVNWSFKASTGDRYGTYTYFYNIE